MPGNVYANSANPGFDGILWLYQYTNNDGQNPGTVCGQAACATLLTYCGKQRANIETLRKIERSHPPDVFWGVFGTSPWRIRAILDHYGAKRLENVSSVDELKRHVGRLCPVICLIQNTEGFGGLPDGAHWFVVFAYDHIGVFVTNYDSKNIAVRLRWPEFIDKWDSPVPGVASVEFKGITNTSRVLPDYVPFSNNIG